MGKGQQTRAMILERAAQLFSRQGYFGSSMSDVMRATGLQKGGIYNHFTDKDALALEAFDYAFGLLWARIEREQTVSARALDELHGLVNVFRSLIQDPLLVGGCPLLNTAVEADDAHPALRRRVRQAMTQLRERIQRAVMRGIADGEIRPDVDGDHQRNSPQPAQLRALHPRRCPAQRIALPGNGERALRFVRRRRKLATASEQPASRAGVLDCGPGAL